MSRGADANIYLYVGEPDDFPTYWTRAAVFNISPARADVTPADQVSGFAEQAALAVLADADAGRLAYFPFGGPLVYLATVDALSALAEGLNETKRPGCSVTSSPTHRDPAWHPTNDCW